MRNYPCYLLSNPEELPLPTGKLWGRGPVLVLGRQFCVHFVLDASGVPGHRVSGFVGLQVTRLAPFAHYAGIFVRQGAKIHVWVWSQEMVSALQLKLGAGKAHWRVLPESLWGEVPTRGTVVQTCAAGVEALRFEGGHLQDAMWWPEMPGEPILKAFSGDTVVSKAADSARERVLSRRRWAKAAQAVPVFGAESPVHGLAAWFRAPLAWVILGWLTLGLAGAHAGWTLASGHRVAQAKLAAQAELDHLLDQGTRDAKGRSGGASTEDVQWVNEVRQLTRGVRLDDLLRQLAEPLAARGLLIRELVIDRDEVKLGLVSGYGGAVDLDEAIAAIEAVGLWQRVELLDFANPLLARFRLKLKAVVGLGAPA